MVDDHGAHAARGVVAPTVRYSPRDEVDYVIVGAGAAGGVMARELATAGARVVVLEQGPYLRAGDFRHDELAVGPLAATRRALARSLAHSHTRTRPHARTLP